MRDRILLALVIVAAIVLSALAQSVTSDVYKDEDEEASAYNVTRVTKTVDGLNFRVVDDRPIVKVGGVYRPIDIDAYVAMKTSDVEFRLNERIDNLNLQIESLRQELDELKRQPSATPAIETKTTAPASEVQTEETVANDSADESIGEES